MHITGNFGLCYFSGHLPAFIASDSIYYHSKNGVIIQAFGNKGILVVGALPAHVRHTKELYAFVLVHITSELALNSTLIASFINIFELNFGSDIH